MSLTQVTNEELLDIESECCDMIQTGLEDNALNLANIGFFDEFVENIFDYMYEAGLNQGWCSIDDDDELFGMVHNWCIEAFYCMKIPMRQNPDSTTNETTPEENAKTLQWLKTFPNHAQRTAEWYAQRHTLFSASNMWKLFGTPAQYNSLIYEKCNDVKKMEFEGDVLSPNARNWGIKYEPVSVQVYEHKYNTVVNTSYGCIPHSTLPIGASPDGINEKPDHPKYGRMLEIKNIYNREMNGIPSKEYWTQMQIQMETCRLEQCDFLETRFKEYSKQEFESDAVHEYKGVVLFFIPKDGNDVKSHFVYVPLFVESVDQWVDQKKETLNTHVLYMTFYWYLDEMYCSLVERNDTWFQATIPIIQEGWETVLKERNSGFAHRAPQKKVAKAPEMVSGGLDLNIMNLVKCDENGNAI